MSYKVLSPHTFVSIISAFAMAMPVALVVLAFAIFADPNDRVVFLIDGLQLSVLGLGTALVLRALFVLGETCEEAAGGVWAFLRAENAAV